MNQRSNRKQGRLAFFVHDGTGLGHLQRVCKLARALQDLFACLIVTGHRAASWLVPEECEFIHLPSLDSLIADKSKYWGRQPFVDMDPISALAFRKSLITSSMQAFDPDALFVDYLPLGKMGELSTVIAQTRASKYLILRGILDEPANVRRDILGGQAERTLQRHYDRILVSCDDKICNVVREYSFAGPVADKTSNVGYISTPVPAADRAELRRQRGVGVNDIWVVCSAGSGALGEKLMEQCMALPKVFPGMFFDLIQGPRSAAKWDSATADCITLGPNRYFKECRQLPLLHSAADIVVCAGGYNSLVESMEGGARIVSAPVQINPADEQFVHAKRLAAYYPLRLLQRLSDLPAILEEEARRHREQRRVNVREVLNFDGAETIKRLLSQDLAAAAAAAGGDS
jgi:predicted glycosyltransferase